MINDVYIIILGGEKSGRKDETKNMDNSNRP